MYVFGFAGRMLLVPNQVPVMGLGWYQANDLLQIASTCSNPSLNNTTRSLCHLTSMDHGKTAHSLSLSLSVLTPFPTVQYH